MAGGRENSFPLYEEERALQDCWDPRFAQDGPAYLEAVVWTSFDSQMMGWMRKPLGEGSAFFGTKKDGRPWSTSDAPGETLFAAQCDVKGF